MPDHDAPPSAAPGAADRLVDDMELFLRGGPVPDATDELLQGPCDGTRTWDAGATASTLSPARSDTTSDH